MATRTEIGQKSYINVPPATPAARWKMLTRALAGGILSPIYWLLSYRYDTPGLRFRLQCARLGLNLLRHRKTSISSREIYRLFFWPMDSTRYFEFAFMWEALSDLSFSRYLDVSSPRLLPIMLTLRNDEVYTDLMNPDPTDLTTTANLVAALQLGTRCGLHRCLVNDAPFDRDSFDVITSVSVIEHIPQDTEAIQKMWALLKPGGRLLLTLPCAARSSEQYIDRNEYGLLASDQDGYFFFQRLYDRQMLEERIISTVGEPRRRVIYGEKSPGALRRNLDRKMGDPSYPYWREPYMMGQEFGYFKSLAELPGEGVIALEFEKQ